MTRSNKNGVNKPGDKPGDQTSKETPINQEGDANKVATTPTGHGANKEVMDYLKTLGDRMIAFNDRINKVDVLDSGSCSDPFKV